MASHVQIQKEGHGVLFVVILLEKYVKLIVIFVLIKVLLLSIKKLFNVGVIKMLKSLMKYLRHHMKNFGLIVSNVIMNSKVL